MAAFDVNSKLDPDNPESEAFYVCGWDNDSGSGIVVHGTKRGGTGRHQWRFWHTVNAPKDAESGVDPVRTEFHGVESLDGPFIRAVGRVINSDDSALGFFYEGPVDGSGDWYPIAAPDAEETIVKASCGPVLVCSPDDLSDEVHVYSLSNNGWSVLHTGFAEEWNVEEIIPAGDAFIIRLLHTGGRRSDVVYSAKP